MKKQNTFKTFAFLLVLSVSFASCIKKDSKSLMLYTVDWPNFQPVSEVTVRIYETKQAFENKEGELATKVSDGDGHVDFDNLKPNAKYWVYATKGNKNSDPNNDFELGNVRYESGSGIRERIFID